MRTLTCRTADREMYLGTTFLRNRPALSLVLRLMAGKPQGSPMRISVLGCRIGAASSCSLSTSIAQRLAPALERDGTGSRQGSRKRRPDIEDFPDAARADRAGNASRLTVWLDLASRGFGAREPIDCIVGRFA